MPKVQTWFARSAIAAVVLVSTSFAAAQLGKSTVDVADFAMHDSQSQRSIDYGVIDTLLKAFVIEQRGERLVRYGVMKGEGQRVIESLVTQIEEVDPTTFNRDEQLAYWLNLRMMMVLHTASEAYPSADPEKLLRADSGYLNTPLVTVKGQELSIADVDHILMAHWQDAPNLLYGLHVPAEGGPEFPVEAFRGSNVHEQLALAGREYVARSKAVKISGDSAKLSSFYYWHRKHLGEGDAALLAHISSLADTKLLEKLQRVTGLKEDFDWNLNVLDERSFADSNNQFGNFGSAGYRGGVGRRAFGGGS